MTRRRSPLTRTPFITPVPDLPLSVPLADPPHWVRIAGIGDEPRRPVCRTCNWSGAAVTTYELAVKAGREHGEVA